MLKCLRSIVHSYRRAGCESPFVILFLPRTGSNLLAALLDSHPDVLCHHEVFNPVSPFRSLSAREGTVAIDLGTAAERDADPYAFLRRVYRTTAGKKAVGFKMSIDDRRYGVLAALLLNRGIRKIIVRRDAWLHAYTSSLIAEQTKSFISFANDRDAGGKAADGRTAVEVNVDHFIRYVKKRRFAFTLLRVLGALSFQRMLEIEYKELKDPDRLRAVLRYLHVSDEVPLKERTAKQNPTGLEERIANYGEVRERLQGTAYARFLAPE
jgi:hypothetical protein